jgi:PKHD-type hydroxylase
MLAHIKGVLSPEEAGSIRAALWPLPFSDGRSTATGMTRERKRNLQLDGAHPEAQRWSQFIFDKLMRSEAFAQVAWPKRMQPFRFCRYEEGMSYGDHVDLPSMGEQAGTPMRTDLSMTIFLNPLDDYEGGQLVIHDESGAKKVRGVPGDMVIYPSNRVHAVEPVTRGTRLVAISWLESRVRQERDRQFLYEMGRSLGGLERRLGEDEGARPDLLRLRNCLYDLTRRWLD